MLTYVSASTDSNKERESEMAERLKVRKCISRITPESQDGGTSKRETKCPNYETKHYFFLETLLTKIQSKIIQTNLKISLKKWILCNLFTVNKLLNV